MTDTTKAVTRRTVAEHSRHKRRIVVTLGPGDTIGFRLERSSLTSYLPIEKLFNQAELATAQALTGFDASPCTNPKKARNVCAK